MGLFEWVMVAIAGGVIHKSRKEAREKAEEAREKAEEEKRRKNTPCHFSDGISETDFKIMAGQAAKHIKRLSISVNGPVIRGTVQSQSGLSEWKFKADFNDYGHISGRYWLSSDNSDSNIPKHFAENIASLIQTYNPADYNQDDNDSFKNSKTNKFTSGYCPYCGEKLTVPNPVFCSFCGKRLT